MLSPRYRSCISASTSNAPPSSRMTFRGDPSHSSAILIPAAPAPTMHRSPSISVPSSRAFASMCMGLWDGVGLDEWELRRMSGAGRLGRRNLLHHREEGTLPRLGEGKQPSFQPERSPVGEVGPHRGAECCLDAVGGSVRTESKMRDERGHEIVCAPLFGMHIHELLAGGADVRDSEKLKDLRPGQGLKRFRRER